MNSQWQLWSVAAYVSMVHDVVFGVSPTQTGLRFEPYITKSIRNDLFAGADTLVLNHFPYRGHDLTVEVLLLPTGADTDGAYSVGEVLLDGQPFTGEIPEGDFAEILSIVVDHVFRRRLFFSPVHTTELDQTSSNAPAATAASNTVSNQGERSSEVDFTLASGAGIALL